MLDLDLLALTTKFVTAPYDANQLGRSPLRRISAIAERTGIKAAKLKMVATTSSVLSR